jgi:nucleoside phosphorylase
MTHCFQEKRGREVDDDNDDNYGNFKGDTANPARREKCARVDHLATLRHEDYTVAWVCALHIEMAAAEAMLDATHPPPAAKHKDSNAYTCGRIGQYNVVITCLPDGTYAQNAAANVAANVSRSFPSLQTYLLVGIGGGVPSAQTDIRLGDVVVGRGMIQYDLGKTIRDGRFKRTSSMCKPPAAPMKVVSKTKSAHERVDSQIPVMLANLHQSSPKMRDYTNRPDRDWLFGSSYEHVDTDAQDCSACLSSERARRNERPHNDPVIHYCIVGSGNQVVKHGETRDRLGQDLDKICLEMEAAGLFDSFPCLVVRGICDYADSHKNKDWQRYAAMVAAAYAKEFCLFLPAARLSLLRLHLRDFSEVLLKSVAS